MEGTRQPGVLRLPYEIREIIYKLLLISDEWIITETQFAKADKPDKLYCYKLPEGPYHNCSAGSCSAQLLRVCKLFDGEASQLLYGRNRFGLSLKTLQETFLPTIGARNASYIRYMDLSWTERGTFKATHTIPTVLQVLPNLRCLYFTTISQGQCTNECQSFCRHTPSQLKIRVLRMAHLITTTHAHLKWFVEFKCSTNHSPAQMWYKLSDDESDRHPQRLHWHPERRYRCQRRLHRHPLRLYQHPDSQYWHPNPLPMPSCKVLEEVVDIEKELARVKVVRIKTVRSVQRTPLPIAERPAWRI
jgi:hypothetical protein